jgi:cobalt/nickel transport system permease protein
MSYAAPAAGRSESFQARRLHGKRAMHMADALLSPAVGGTMWAATAVAVAHCSRRLRIEADDRRVPLMGVLGAFLFTAQMINFSIPGTGSSGHLGGGLLLAILLGPHAAFLVVASVLIVQALFFADGGLLALGCNIFNLGFLPAFLGYPLYRRLAGRAPGTARATTAAITAAVVSLQLGAVAVVLQTVASGISALPLGTFALFMLPVHLAIGIVEGLVTAAVVVFVRATRPDILPTATPSNRSVTGVAVSFAAVALALGGIGAWFASTNPDGLEWSIARITGADDLDSPLTALHARSAELQRRVAVLPDYGFRQDAGRDASPEGASAASNPHRPGDRLGTSLAGILGGAGALFLALLVGFVLRRKAQPT